MMKILLVRPPGAPHGGNAHTTHRWSRLLRSLGHTVRVLTRYAGEDGEIMIALHARKSAGAARVFGEMYPDRPLVVGLAGTDLYPDIAKDSIARGACEQADRLVVLHPDAGRALPAGLRHKTVVIYQSAVPLKSRPAPRKRTFDVVVLAHLRPVKDPLRAAMASRSLPATSRIRVLLAGRALSRGFEERALQEMRRNPRFVWLGDLPHGKALRHLAMARAVVVSSRSEGGANVVGEAAVHGIPVLASRIPGSLGLLGRDYPATFPVGDTRALALLLQRLETDPVFERALKTWMKRLAPLFDSRRERRAWRDLLRGL